MDNNKIVKNILITSTILIIVFGSLLHFVYGWTSNNFIVGFLSPVNESVWEHMKLSFVPILLVAIPEYFLLKGKVNNFSVSLAFAELIPIVFMISFFYLYTLFLKENLTLDILSFIAGVCLGKLAQYKILFYKKAPQYLNITSIFFIIALSALFILATLNPPRISLFENPETKTYGIYQLR